MSSPIWVVLVSYRRALAWGGVGDWVAAVLTASVLMRCCCLRSVAVPCPADRRDVGARRLACTICGGGGGQAQREPDSVSRCRFLPGDALCVDPQQDGDAVSGPFGNASRLDAAVKPGGHGGVP